MITRASRQASVLADSLKALGAVPLVYPTIETRSIHDSSAWNEIRQLVTPQRWLLFTSENGVTFFFHHLDEQREDRLVISGMKTAVIGEKTARTLRKLDIAPDFVASTATARAMAVEFLERVKSAEPAVVRVRGNLADNTIEDALRRAGVTVIPLTVYETINPQWSKKRKEELLRHPPDAIVFTSGSTVNGLRKNISDKDCDMLVAHAEIFSIGPSTSKAIAARGWEITGEADPHSAEGIIDAITRHYTTKT